MDLPENKIITFQQDTVERKRYFKAASFAHPAKMVLGLQIYLIEHYTKPGDVILDPMAGSGTILIACAIGRNVVLVELEDKFVKMQQDNWEKLKSLGPMLFYKMGAATILKGDARNLNGLLADNILFSPPYAEMTQTGGKALADKIKASPNSMARMVDGYSENPNNIGNLPYGKISAVISSPPYAEASHHKDELDKVKYLGIPNKAARPGSTAGERPDNIGNLPYGKADAVITSPPYEGSLEGKTRHKFDKIHKEKKLGTFTDLDPSVERLRNHGRTDPKAGGAYGRSLAHPYSGAADNIGNLKSENYLEAMAQVYRECWKVLKPGGLMVLVVKNFIRDKKIVRLDLDTIKICEKAEFILKERLKRKLTQQSFWRTIYHAKYPDVEKIEYEDVLVFEKGK